MTQDTKNKFAAILAAAQTKAGTYKVSAESQELPKNIGFNPDTQKFQSLPDAKQENGTPQEFDATDKAKLLSFTILWQEGSGKFDGRVFNTWGEANRAMAAIYKEHSGLGYLKVKINVKWDNGAEITDRADCSDSAGDFSPTRESIGEYLSKLNSVMYASNMNVGDRKNLSFTDDKIHPELSTTTIADLLSEKAQIIAEESVKILADELSEAKRDCLQIVDYSDKAFAVIGNTKPIKEQLKQLGGRFNPLLKCGAGWIFSKQRLEIVKTTLSI